MHDRWSMAWGLVGRKASAVSGSLPLGLTTIGTPMDASLLVHVSQRETYLGLLLCKTTNAKFMLRFLMLFNQDITIGRYATTTCRVSTFGHSYAPGKLVAQRMDAIEPHPLEKIEVWGLGGASAMKGRERHRRDNDKVWSKCLLSTTDCFVSPIPILMHCVPRLLTSRCAISSLDVLLARPRLFRCHTNICMFVCVIPDV